MKLLMNTWNTLSELLTNVKAQQVHSTENKLNPECSREQKAQLQKVIKECLQADKSDAIIIDTIPSELTKFKKEG